MNGAGHPEARPDAAGLPLHLPDESGVRALCGVAIDPVASPCTGALIHDECAVLALELTARKAREAPE